MRYRCALNEILGLPVWVQIHYKIRWRSRAHLCNTDDKGGRLSSTNYSNYTCLPISSASYKNRLLGRTPQPCRFLPRSRGHCDNIDSYPVYTWDKIKGMTRAHGFTQTRNLFCPSKPPQCLSPQQPTFWSYRGAMFLTWWSSQTDMLVRSFEWIRRAIFDILFKWGILTVSLLFKLFAQP